MYKDTLSTKTIRTKLLLSVEWDKSSHTKNRTLTWHFVQERHHQTCKQHPYHLPLFSFFWIWQRLFRTVTKDQHCLVNFDPQKCNYKSVTCLKKFHKIFRFLSFKNNISRKKRYIIRYLLSSRNWRFFFSLCILNKKMLLV